MMTQRHLTPGLAGFLLVMAVASPLRAADPALEDFKAEIDAVISGLAPGTNGLLEWVGADPYEIRRDGDTLVATITGARLKFRADQTVGVVLDRFEIRQTTARDGKDLTVLLPKQVILSEADSTEAKLTLEDGRVNALIDAKSGRVQAIGVAVAGAARRSSHNRGLAQLWAAGDNVEAGHRARRAVECADRVRAQKSRILVPTRGKRRSHRSDCF